MAWYKRDADILYRAETSITTPSWTIGADTSHDQPEPVHGWTWYDTDDAAYMATAVAALNLQRHMANVCDYGARGDGVADDTAAMQAALDSGAQVVYAPSGVYNVTGLIVPDLVQLVGDKTYAYTAMSGSGTRIRSTNAAQTAPVISLSYGASLLYLDIVGAGRSADTKHVAVRAAFGNVIDGCHLGLAAVGYDGNLKSGTRLVGCSIHMNHSAGIVGIVDSQVRGCVINANTGPGIELSGGASTNIINGNKIEWNGAHGLSLTDVHDNVIANNIVDRNGKCGISLVDSKWTVITGNNLKRNGAQSSGSPEDDTHIRLQNCTNNLIVGNMTRDYMDDDNVSGYRSPAYCIRESYGAGNLITGNHLGGCTSGTPYVITVAAADPTVLFGNRGLTGYQQVNGSRTAIAALEHLTPASSSATFTISLNPAEAWTCGVAYRLDIGARNGGTAGRYLASVPILVSRESAASRTFGTLVNQIGEAFGVGSGMFRVDATVNADGAVLTVTVANTSTAAHNISIRLT